MNHGQAPTLGSYSSPRGRGSPSPAAYSAPLHSHVGADGDFADDSFGSGDGIPRCRGRNSQQRSLGSNSKHSEYKPVSGYTYQPQMSSPVIRKERFSQIGTFHPGKLYLFPNLQAGKLYLFPNLQIGADGDFADDSFGSGDGIPRGRGRNSQQRSLGSNSKHSEHKPTSGYAYQVKIRNKTYAEVRGSTSKQSNSTNEDDLPSLSAQSGSNDIHPDAIAVSLATSLVAARKIQTGQTPGEGAGDGTTLHLDFSVKVNIGSLQDESQLPSKFGSQKIPFQNQGTNNTAGNKDLEHSERSAVLEPFDICPTKRSGAPVMLKPSLLAKNREKRNEIKRSMEGQNASVLRSGMIILRSYISLSDQVKIVKACRDLGLGSGGFYQPGYRDGAKLHLKMMCLGKNWDPETSEYGDRRPTDGATPPVIPNEFYQLVENAINDSHALIKRNSKASNVEDILPRMSPNVCIVNFYSASGKLGLHQDRDESQESLQKKLPVVSFSIGDKAEFLYGDQRDADKAEKVELASGDVLIFGGKSRHIFHGVSAILQNTAPKAMLEDTKLRPGRLNLTFREF